MKADQGHLEEKFTTDTLLAALRDYGTASAAMVSLAGGPSFYDAQKDRNDARDLVVKHFSLQEERLSRMREALKQAERRMHGAWQMLEAICDNDFSRDRKAAAERAYDGLFAIQKALEE